MAGSRKKFRIIITAENKASAPLKVVQQQIKKIGQSMRRVGRSMTMGLSAPILAFGGFTIKVAADFEASMNRVRGLTKATGEDFEKLRNQAKLLGRTTQFSASQAAEAMEEMAKTGFSTTQVYEALPGVLQLAAASSVDLGEAAGLASGLLKGFGMEASEMTRINDVLVTTNISTKTQLIDLAETLKEIAPLANGMGLELGEVAASAGFMGDALMEGGRGGIALRNIMLSLTAATPEAQSTLNKLKIPRANLIDSEGNLKSMIAVVRELERAGAGVEDFKDIFGKRGVTPMMALVNRGAEALQDLTDKINGDESVGEAARQAAIRMEGAAGAMLEFKSAVEGLQIAIGDSGLLRDFTETLEGITRFTQGLSESDRALLRTGTIVAGLVAIVGPLILLIGVAATVFAAFTAPVWITIAAVMALIAAAALLIKFWEPVKAFFIGLGEIITGFFTGLDSAFSTVRGLLPDFLTNAIALDVGGQFATAADGGGSIPVPPPAQAEVAGQIGIQIESDVPARVTTLETSGDVEISVDSGPGMGGF